MKLRKLRKAVVALLLTGTMIMGMGTGAFAEEEEPVTPPTGSPTLGTGTESSPATASVNNHLEFAEGITLPATPGVKFEYEITAVTDGAPTASVAAVIYDSTDAKGTLTDKKYTLHKPGAITFEEFPHAGKYEYTAQQKTGTADGITYATEKYKLYVYVANKTTGNGLYVKAITASQTNALGEEVKVHSLHFTNKYTKNASLTVKKQVDGELADTTKDFTFKITFYPAANSTATEFTGMKGTTAITCKVNEKTEFKLHHGESLEFSSLPAGTRYKVEEVGALDGYKPSVVVWENGMQNPPKEETSDSAGLTSEAEGKNDCLAGENTNSVSFTNTYNEVALTGVIMNNLPFILLIALGVCALGLLAVAKKRRMSDR